MAASANVRGVSPRKNANYSDKKKECEICKYEITKLNERVSSLQLLLSELKTDLMKLKDVKSDMNTL